MRTAIGWEWGGNPVVSQGTLRSGELQMSIQSNIRAHLAGPNPENPGRTRECRHAGALPRQWSR
jgi:hypothetical protein